MTEYALAPATPATKLIDDVAAMLDAGELHAYRVRSNGTMRRLALLPLGSTERETAEWISDAIDMDGRSVQSVARELHSSTPTVRRFLEALELTEEIEAGEWNGIWTAHEANSEAGEVVEDIMDLLDNPPLVADLIEANKTGEVAPRPTRTRTAKVCTGGCGKNVTGRNSAAKLRAAFGYDDMCAVCYDAAGLENEHSDGHHAEEPNADCPQCKTTIVLARNRAMFTSTPQPTDAERAAALADVPGAQCEPVGTPTDEVEAALAASVAAAEATPRVGTWTTLTPGRASQGTAACFCGDNGVHVPGAAGCKHPAIPRRTRSHG